MAGLGGGQAWARDHEEILEHARNLGYDKVPGVSLPSADAPKEEWIPAMDAFNAWKAGEVAKEASNQAWWQTYPGSEVAESLGREGGGFIDSGVIPRGPYPAPNQYFPLLTTEYTRPQAYDETAFNYIPNWIQSGPFPGLLYQTGTEQYNEAFPMEQSILEYQPNIFGVGPVQYYAPTSPLEVAHHEESSSSSKKKGNDDDEYDWASDPEGRRDGNPGIGLDPTEGFYALSQEARDRMRDWGFEPDWHLGSENNPAMPGDQGYKLAQLAEAQFRDKRADAAKKSIDNAALHSKGILGQDS